MSDMMCCPLSGSDDCGPSAWFEKTRVARLVHKCGECGDEIAKGQRYRYESGVWDGRASSHKTCWPCYKIREHFACDGFVFEQLWEDIMTNFFPTMSAGGGCMAGLPPEGKAKLFDEYNHWVIHNFEERAWWMDQDEKAHQAREWLAKQKGASCDQARP